MRTESQITFKMNQLKLQRQSVESRIAPLSGDDPLRNGLLSELNRLDELILILEWVLNEPRGKYHA